MEIRRLTCEDLNDFRAMMARFAEAFDDGETYLSAPRSDDAARALLGRDDYVALVARVGARVIGALSAYTLHKPEQDRAEVYIYDLAVAEGARRRGVATALIEALKPIAIEAGAWVIYVQADYEDPPAVALYEKLGAREKVLHFDISPKPRP